MTLSEGRRHYYPSGMRTLLRTYRWNPLPTANVSLPPTTEISWDEWELLKLRFIWHLPQRLLPVPSPEKSWFRSNSLFQLPGPFRFRYLSENFQHHRENLKMFSNQGDRYFLPVVCVTINYKKRNYSGRDSICHSKEKLPL